MESNQPLLLVVEDDPSQQKVILALAARYGYSTIVVDTGREALAALSACDTCFDAILMDWKMPQMNGIECTYSIREMESKQRRRTPIIAVTAYASEYYHRACLEAGMDDYLSKPFDPEAFREILHKWTHKAALSNVRTFRKQGEDEAL
jgi:two-component system, sensor histidine kinase and response regulator